MEKKKIIQIAIIVAAFGVSGAVLYRGFAKSGSKVINPSTLTAQLSTPAGIGSAQPIADTVILPHGSRMDFEGVFKKRNFVFGAVKEPELDPSQDVGIPTQSLLRASLSE